MNRCLAAFLALLFASLTISGACFAQTSEATFLVRYDDLDLSTAGGVETLQRRLARAASEVCLDKAGRFPTGTVDFYCKIDALGEARRQMGEAIAQQRLSRSPAISASAK